MQVKMEYLLKRGLSIRDEVVDALASDPTSPQHICELPAHAEDGRILVVGKVGKALGVTVRDNHQMAWRHRPDC
jgi:hypothetical protein